MSDFDLNDHVFRLLQNEPFFAALSRRIDKRPGSDVPTAGVTITEDGQFELIYNPEFFAGLNDDQQRTLGYKLRYRFLSKVLR